MNCQLILLDRLLRHLELYLSSHCLLTHTLELNLLGVIDQYLLERECTFPLNIILLGGSSLLYRS